MIGYFRFSYIPSSFFSTDSQIRITAMFLSTIFAFFGTAHATQQVFYGRFISTPQPDRLLIQSGAVLVNDTDGTGVITKTAWNVTDLEKALSQLDASKDVLVVRASEEGFFFPGFIGTNL